MVFYANLSSFPVGYYQYHFTSFLPNAVTSSSPSQWLISWQHSTLIASRNSAFWLLKHNHFLSLLTVTLLYFVSLSFSMSYPLNVNGLKAPLLTFFFLFFFELSPCVTSYTPKASFPAKNNQLPAIYLQAHALQLSTTQFAWKMETDLFIFCISLNT